MKKKFLFLGLMAAALSSAQTYVTEDAPVKVEEGTLFYHGAGLEVTSATAVFTNQGNVQVEGGDFKMTNPGTADNFYNEWQAIGVGTADGTSSDNGYGQLIINQAVNTTGKIAMDKKMPAANAIDNVQTTFPFIGYKGNDLVSDTGFAFTSSTNRDNHQMFRWNNFSIRWDRFYGPSTVQPHNYYFVRTINGFAGYDSGIGLTHKGVANNKMKLVNFPDHSSLPVLWANNNRNTYNEVYTSYINDAYRDKNVDADWGKNFIQLGNPYTSNIDLSFIGFDEEAAGAFFDANGNNTKDADEDFLQDEVAISGLLGVSKITGGRQVGGSNGTRPNVYVELHARTDESAGDGVFVSGDEKTLIVKPFETFIIKTDGTAGQSLTFNDGLKTFSYSAKANHIDDGNGGLDFRSGSTSGFGNDYYQVRLELFENGENTNKRMYVVANANVANGVGGSLEVENTWEGNNSGIYTQEEVAVGEGVDQNRLNRKMYINQINTDYLGVAIPVTIKGLSVGDSYTIDFDLLNGIIELEDTQNSFNNSNAKYYFHDIYLDQYFEIMNDSDYTFTKNTNDGTGAGNRFELFFGDTNENLGTEDLNLVSNTTVVYNNGDSNSIRFDKEWNKANISVYTSVGQIVFAEKNIDTAQDFVLPLQNVQTAAFIVKIENAETGEVISQKIIENK